MMITDANIVDARNECAAMDQAYELVIGCSTWAITYTGGQRGQMTRWPNGRGAVAWGGGSSWGDWVGDVLYLDDGETRVDRNGEEIVAEMAYENESHPELPDGWTLAVWPDGRALVCSPRTCPRELGGREVSSVDAEAAIEAVRELIERL